MKWCERPVSIGPHQVILVAIERDRARVFTQLSETLDLLRRELRPVDVYH